MRVCGKKLKSKRGAAIIIALLFFLVAAIVGSIVLASASSNAGRLSHIREEQQAYLSVSSAATLLNEMLSGMAFEDKTYIDYNEEDYINTPFPIENPPQDVPKHLEYADAAAPNDLQDAVFDRIKAVYEMDDSSRPETITINLTIDPDNAELSPVRAKIVINTDDYALKAYLTLDDAGAEVQYPMTVAIPCSFSERPRIGTVTRYYSQPFPGGGIPARVPVQIGYTGMDTTIKYNMPGIITKGGAPIA